MLQAISHPGFNFLFFLAIFFDLYFFLTSYGDVRCRFCYNQGLFCFFCIILILILYKNDTFIKIDLKHFNYDRSIFVEILKLAVPIVLMFIFSEVFNLGGFGVVFSVFLSEAIQSVLMFFVLRFKIDNQIENNSCVPAE